MCARARTGVCVLPAWQGCAASPVCVGARTDPPIVRAHTHTRMPAGRPIPTIGTTAVVVAATSHAAGAHTIIAAAATAAITAATTSAATAAAIAAATAAKTAYVVRVQKHYKGNVDILISNSQYAEF